MVAETFYHLAVCCMYLRICADAHWRIDKHDVWLHMFLRDRQELVSLDLISFKIKWVCLGKGPQPQGLKHLNRNKKMDSNMSFP